jgi:hypothetical protein
MFFLLFSNSTTKSISLSIVYPLWAKLPKTPMRVTPNLSWKKDFLSRRYATKSDIVEISISSSP